MIPTRGSLLNLKTSGNSVPTTKATPGVGERGRKGEEFHVGFGVCKAHAEWKYSTRKDIRQSDDLFVPFVIRSLVLRLFNCFLSLLIVVGSLVISFSFLLISLSLYLYSYTNWSLPYRSRTPSPSAVL